MAILTVFFQMLSLLIMIGAGWFMARKGMMDEHTNTQMSKMIVNVFNPMLMISSAAGSVGLIPLSTIVLVGLIAIGMFAILIAAGMILSPLFERQPDQKKIFQMMFVFSNLGFIGIPVVGSILGTQYVVYVTEFLLLYTIVFYTYGVAMMDGKFSLSSLKAMVNPGLISGLAAVLIIVLNIPLFYICVRMQGLKSLLASLYAMSMGSLMLDAFAAVHVFSPRDEPLLACICGGVLLGASMGIMLTVGATTGGTELAARLEYKLRNLSIGRLCLSIDVTVICLYAFTFRSVNNALYGIVAMYISSLTMDTVVYGSINAKIAYIISGHSGEVAKRLLGLDLGITLLDGRGGYSGDRKQVVLCAFKRSQFAVVKATVTAIDPNAFIIVCEAHEVLGEGFGEYSPDSL